MQKNPEYLNNYGAFLINSRNYGEAVIELKRATSDPLYSTPQFAWTNLAQAYAGLKDLSAARDALDRALYLVPNYPPALLMLAELDYNDGKADAAFAHLQVVLAQEPDNADALLLAGRIAALRGADNTGTVPLAALCDCFTLFRSRQAGAATAAAKRLRR